MKLTRLMAIAGLGAAVFGASAAEAGAATRYAAAGSGVNSGTCATTGTACAVGYAISGAALDDTVVLMPGTYNLTGSLVPSTRLTIRGQAGQARPVLAGGPGLTGPTLDMTANGTLERVALSSSAPYPAFVGKQVQVSDVKATAQSAHAAEVKAGSATVVRDSLFHTTAGSPYAALSLKDDENTGTLDVVNVTAVGTAPGSTGIAQGSGSAVTVVNTIAQGGQYDIWETVAATDANVSYSSFRGGGFSSGVAAGLGNVGPAAFKTGTFEPATGSATIDSGTTAVTLGPDLAGIVRGTSPDIGAYEYVAGGEDGEGGDGGEGGEGGTTPPPPPPGDTTTPPGGGSTTPPPSGDDAAKPDATPGGDGSGTGSGGDSSPLPPAAPPVLGGSVGLGPVKGAVTVKLPGSAQAVPLRAGASVPVGSVIDATRGTVALTSVRDSSGKVQTGQFWGGVFKVGQSRRGRVYTDLTLVGRLTCPRPGARERVSAAARRWSRRRLWGRDRGGRFRTRGRNGSATVRGTEWLTEDSCKGTLFRVKKGAIVVRDKAKRKNVVLKRGGRYLARAKRR